jgi:hypothetical protein
MKNRSVRRWRGGICKGDYAEYVSSILPALVVVQLVFGAIHRYWPAILCNIYPITGIFCLTSQMMLA